MTLKLVAPLILALGCTTSNAAASEKTNFGASLNAVNNYLQRLYLIV